MGSGIAQWLSARKLPVSLRDITPEQTAKGLDRIKKVFEAGLERQTFTRLPRSQGLLFGIHTYNSSVAEEASDPNRARSILNVLRGAPREVMDYKAITPIENPLVTFLEQRASV